jgi:hypothetical protein
MRLTAEEEEIQQNCGQRSDLFFPATWLTISQLVVSSR